jgi:hypothetical protein
LTDNQSATAAGGEPSNSARTLGIECAGRLGQALLHLDDRGHRLVGVLVAGDEVGNVGIVAAGVDDRGGAVDDLGEGYGLGFGWHDDGLPDGLSHVSPTAGRRMRLAGLDPDSGL